VENRVWEKIDSEVSKIKEGMPSSKKIVEVTLIYYDSDIDCGQSYRRRDSRNI
jgi:hypothetical protein